jgi:ferredoxin
VAPGSLPKRHKLMGRHGLHACRIKAILKPQTHIVDLPDTAKGFTQENPLIFVGINPVFDCTIDNDSVHKGPLLIWPCGVRTSGLLQARDLSREYLTCGSRAMYAFADEQIAKLGLPRRRVRRELYGEYGDPARDPHYPQDAKGKTYRLKVVVRGASQVILCRADQTLLGAMEQNSIHAPSHCRSGECGWCHSRLISGSVFIPEVADGRRAADQKFGWVHPCCTYPLSDVALEVPTIP